MNDNDGIRKNYILIVGQGRSGTNWLLDLLNLSLNTYCRNEANEIENAPLAKLLESGMAKTLDESFGNRWDEAIAAETLLMSDRDRLGLTPKFYLRESVRKLGGTALLSKKKIRKILSVFQPNLKNNAWLVPAWLANPEKLKQALTVFKLNQVPAYAEWVLKNRPDTLVIHIVRHPGGFLNSWEKRYLALKNKEAVKQANEERLKTIVLHNLEWAKIFGNIETMTVDESELWYWLYANEIIYNAGNGSANYLLIVYEDLVNNTLEVIQQLYEKCQLAWTPEIEGEINKSTSKSGKIATAWQKKLSEEQIKLVEKVLARSLMSQWWDNLTV